MFKRSFDKLDEIAVQAELKVGKDRKSSEFFSKLLSEAKECHLNDNDSDDSLGDSYGPPAVLSFLILFSILFYSICTFRNDKRNNVFSVR